MGARAKTSLAISVTESEPHHYLNIIGQFLRLVTRRSSIKVICAEGNDWTPFKLGWGRPYVYLVVKFQQFSFVQIWCIEREVWHLKVVHTFQRFPRGGQNNIEYLHVIKPKMNLAEFSRLLQAIYVPNLLWRLWMRGIRMLS